jgi:hypothetical protein
MLLVLGVNAMSRRVVCVNSPTRLDVVLRAGLAVGAHRAFLKYVINFTLPNEFPFSKEDVKQFVRQKLPRTNQRIKCNSKYSPIISWDAEGKPNVNHGEIINRMEESIDKKEKWLSIWEWCVCCSIMKNYKIKNTKYTIKPFRNVLGLSGPYILSTTLPIDEEWEAMLLKVIQNTCPDMVSEGEDQIIIRFAIKLFMFCTTEGNTAVSESAVFKDRIEMYKFLRELPKNNLRAF